MNTGLTRLIVLWLPALFALTVVLAAAEPDDPAVKRGEYLFRAVGGCGCHTDVKNQGPLLGGGRPIPTPFGTFYGTNITPHPEPGIGRWDAEDFLRAMRQGIGPDGSHYFPVFPYTSFSRMTEADLRDLWAYLRSVPPAERRNRPHDPSFPFSWRLGARVWKALNFAPVPFREEPSQSLAWNRGAYLAEAVGHCGECHTPRNLLGAARAERRFAGSRDGPEGELAPNITPDEDTGIGSWNEADLVWFLETSLKPNGDDAQGLMGRMIDQGFRHLSDADKRALAVYLLSLPPIRNDLRPPGKE